MRYDLACDYLEEDLASGYVRVLEEMLAAGWAEPALAEQVSGLLRSWFGLLTRVMREAGSSVPTRTALRRVGVLIRLAEGESASPRESTTKA